MLLEVLSIATLCSKPLAISALLRFLIPKAPSSKEKPSEKAAFCEEHQSKQRPQLPLHSARAFETTAATEHAVTDVVRICVESAAAATSASSALAAIIDEAARVTSSARTPFESVGEGKGSGTHPFASSEDAADCDEESAEEVALQYEETAGMAEGTFEEEGESSVSADTNTVGDDVERDISGELEEEKQVEEPDRECAEGGADALASLSEQSASREQPDCQPHAAEVPTSDALAKRQTAVLQEDCASAPPPERRAAHAREHAEDLPREPGDSEEPGAPDHESSVYAHGPTEDTSAPGQTSCAERALQITMQVSTVVRALGTPGDAPRCAEVRCDTHRDMPADAESACASSEAEVLPAVQCEGALSPSLSKDAQAIGADRATVAAVWAGMPSPQQPSAAAVASRSTQVSPASCSPEEPAGVVAAQKGAVSPASSCEGTLRALLSDVTMAAGGLSGGVGSGYGCSERGLDRGGEGEGEKDDCEVAGQANQKWCDDVQSVAHFVLRLPPPAASACGVGLSAVSVEGAAEGSEQSGSGTDLGTEVVERKEDKGRLSVRGDVRRSITFLRKFSLAARSFSKTKDTGEKGAGANVAEEASMEEGLQERGGRRKEKGRLRRWTAKVTRR